MGMLRGIFTSPPLQAGLTTFPVDEHTLFLGLLKTKLTRTRKLHLYQFGRHLSGNADE
jgi:hypothetical protein